MDKPAKGLQCVNCERNYPILPINYCDACFSPVIPVFSPTLRGEDLKRSILAGPQNLFRFDALLPTNSKPNYEVGYTDLSNEDALGEQIGLKTGNFFLKVDYGTVSGTFKDRGVAVVVQLFKEFNETGYNFQALAGTSTGNLAAAIAAGADKNNLKSIVIVHKGAHQELVKKTSSFGAYVLVVETDYSAVNDIVNRISSFDDNLASRIAWVNTNLRPLYGTGPKTIGFEIVEQLGWKAPRHIVHPFAAGLSLWQIYQALTEFNALGLLPKLETAMHAIQPSQSKPFVAGWETYRKTGVFELERVQSPTSIAETLCVARPSNADQGFEVLKRSIGSAVSVSEEEIIKGVDLVSRYTEKYGTGPVGGVVIAGVKKLIEIGDIKPDELTVAVLTDGFYKDRGEIRGNKEGKIISLTPDEKIVKHTLEQILEGKI